MVSGYGMRPGNYMMAPPGYPMYAPPGPAAGMYSGMPTPGWSSAPPQPMVSGYATQSYQPLQHGDYHHSRTSSGQQPMSMKLEDHNGSASSSYSHYPNPTPYQSRPTSSSFSSYVSPMRPQSSSSYGQVAQAQYPTPNLSTAQAQQQPQSYSGTPTQPQAFDSKGHSSYVNQGSPSGYNSIQNPAVHDQSQQLRSPPATSPDQGNMTNYRQYPGPAPSSASAADAEGLGVTTPGYGSSTASQSGQYTGGHYTNYSQSGQGYGSGGTDGHSTVSSSGRY